jgi:hypothetical protein
VSLCTVKGLDGGVSRVGIETVVALEVEDKDAAKRVEEEAR